MPRHKHLLSREIDDWLPTKLQSLIDGSYTPQHVQRYYFQDETVDQLTIPDRVLQHVLLKVLKPTFKHITHPACYHLLGPTGVKRVTEDIRSALKNKNITYFIRVDIKSFYRSIPHFKLMNDINRYFDDPKVRTMLKRIIQNPIETPRGYRNPDTGIALRGPLSQLFSAIYLKPLDDAFNNNGVVYARYQDDILILCESKRQFNRARHKMKNVLHERQLSLSRKKSRMGLIEDGFHFLGVDYPGTQTQGKTKADQIDHSLTMRGGVESHKLLRHMPEPFVMPENELNGWCKMGLLPKQSNVTCFDGRFGGQSHLNSGRSKICYSTWRSRVGIKISNDSPWKHLTVLLNRTRHHRLGLGCELV